MKTILFDLDGTLLPMDQEIFIKAYFHALAKKMAPYGYEPERLIQAVWKGTGRMVRNTGEKTNEEVFWEDFAEVFGERAYEDRRLFDEFYENEFHEARKVCGVNPAAEELIRKLKSAGYGLILATNPLFPMTAQKNRISWAGLDFRDFDYITSYENSSYCKPNPDYYRQVLGVRGLDAADCLMVGNDVQEDMIAGSLGIDTFLLTDCLINSKEKDISVYRRGSFGELSEYILG